MKRAASGTAAGAHSSCSIIHLLMSQRFYIATILWILYFLVVVVAASSIGADKKCSRHGIRLARGSRIVSGWRRAHNAHRTEAGHCRTRKKGFLSVGIFGAGIQAMRERTRTEQKKNTHTNPETEAQGEARAPAKINSNEMKSKQTFWTFSNNEPCEQCCIS